MAAFIVDEECLAFLNKLFLVVKNVACYHCRILQLIVPDYIL